MRPTPQQMLWQKPWQILDPWPWQTLDLWPWQTLDQIPRAGILSSLTGPFSHPSTHSPRLLAHSGLIFWTLSNFFGISNIAKISLFNRSPNGVTAAHAAANLPHGLPHPLHPLAHGAHHPLALPPVPHHPPLPRQTILTTRQTILTTRQTILTSSKNHRTFD